jgi:hypothetical protein
MQKMRRLLSLALIFALALSLAGCFDINQYIPSTQESTGDGLTTYHITVRTHSGQYLKDVGVRVFADKEKTDLVWYDKTDANGKMSFIADTFDGYVVALENIPTGYMKADYYALTGVDNEIVLTVGLQSDVDLNTVELQLGSAMVDMTVTAGAEEYTISKLLAGKKAVVLHFFDGGVADGLACLEEAWLDYADEVAVLALNPVDGDVSVYAEGKKLPVEHCIKGTKGWEIADGLYVKGCKIIDKPNFGWPNWKDENLQDVEIIGLCTDICVVSNALIIKASFPDANITVDSKCCAGVTVETHNAALKTMGMCQINVL